MDISVGLRLRHSRLSRSADLRGLVPETRLKSKHPEKLAIFFPAYYVDSFYPSMSQVVFFFKLLSMQVEDELVRRRLEGQLVRKSLASFTVSFLHMASFALLGFCRGSENIPAPRFG